MSAKLKLVGQLKSFMGGQNEVDVEAGRTVRETLEKIGIRPEIIALVLVNDEQGDKDYVLQDGDVAKLLAVIGGG